MAYQIFTDATADLSGCFPENNAAIEIIPMQIEIGGREYTYGPSGDIYVEEFYRLQKDGNFDATSQINPMFYSECFRTCLNQKKRYPVSVFYFRDVRHDSNS